MPVMLPEVLDALNPVLARGHASSILDATFGGGGYARAFLSAGCTVWAIDRDPDAIARGAELAMQYAGQFHLVEGRFGAMLSLMAGHGVVCLDGVVLDLGVSSFQLDQPARGFSFRADGPLDMRMGRDGVTAADLVATLDEVELADTLYRFGEERLSRRIARAIVRARAEAPITTTGRLASVIRSVVPASQAGGIDPATRSFQALRIRVNDELGEIGRALEGASALLAPGGRLVVVSFHSLEDRLVKRFMTEAAGRAPAPSRHDPGNLFRDPAPAGFRLVGSRARRAGEAETRANPRARSAKLRTLERVAAERVAA